MAKGKTGASRRSSASLPVGEPAWKAARCREGACPLHRGEMPWAGADAADLIRRCHRDTGGGEIEDSDVAAHLLAERCPRDL